MAAPSTSTAPAAAPSFCDASASPGNQATDLGGAIHTWMYGLPSGMTIEDSVFNNNTSGSNGGAIFHMNGRLDIARSAFHDNSAFAQGGGLWVLADGGRPNDTPVTITNATFYRNRADRVHGGKDCWAIRRRHRQLRRLEPGAESRDHRGQPRRLDRRRHRE